MDKRDRKNNLSSISTTGTTSESPHYSSTVDGIVKYTNLNFNQNSESSSQTKDFQEDPRKEQKDLYATSVPKKILPQSLEKDYGAESESAVKEMSLREMGFNANETEGWKDIQPSKQNLCKLFKEMVDNNTKPSVQIRIGSVSLNCHMMVLQCYSELFMELDNEIVVEIPEEKVTPVAFMMVYDWMVAEKPLVQRERILELFNAANFLRIPDLIKQCWFCLGDDECFYEDTAFLLYLEARIYKLEKLEQLMLMRVCQFFLTVVASREYLDLSAKEICTLLSSNTIGVNSEIEIFMSAIRWLSENWMEREQYLLDIMNCVRFTLMPSWFMLTLTMIDQCEEIDRVVHHPKVNKMINDGISYVALQMHYGENREEFLKIQDNLELVPPQQRQWLYDKRCSYHHRLDCPTVEYSSYETFLIYLEQIRNGGKDYWRSMVMIKNMEKPIKCCPPPDGRKSTDHAIVTISSLQSCDQGMKCEVDKRNPKAKGEENQEMNSFDGCSFNYPNKHKSSKNSSDGILFKLQF